MEKLLITILSAGSRGDTQPYVALGLELKKLGHRVRLAAHENYADWIKSFDLEVHLIPGDVSAVASSQFAGDAMRADNPLKIIRSFKLLSSLVFDLQADFFAACAGAQAVVYHPGATIGYFAAQQLDIPAVLACPFPMAPTREYPSLIFYNGPRLGKGLNLVTHKLFEQVMWSASRSAVRQFWKAQFGRLPEDFGCPYPRQTTRRMPTVISCSDHVFARPGDWPEHVHNTGYWFLDGETDWQPPADLVDFLARGEPPVYVGFGSAGDAARAAQTTRLVVDALKRSGKRGILATGWSGMARMDGLPDDIYILESAPHAWLFPRVSAVVHHGGAGTTAAGLRAGVPAVVVPFANDQFAWGRRIYELGAGSKPIPRKSLSVEKLAEALKFALSDKIMTAARELGDKIQRENGAARAAQVIVDAIAV